MDFSIKPVDLGKIHIATPVVLSPFNTDHCIGAAPLYFGNNDP